MQASGEMAVERRWLRVLIVLGLAVGIPALSLLVDFVQLWLGLRLLRWAGLGLMEGIGAEQITAWAWDIALIRVPFGILHMIFFSTPAFWYFMRTGRTPKSLNRLRSAISDAVIFTFAALAAYLALRGQITDPGRLAGLVAVSAVLAELTVTWRVLRVSRLLREIGRAFRAVDRAPDDESTMAIPLSCKTGHHTPWCGHLVEAEGPQWIDDTFYPPMPGSRHPEDDETPSSPGLTGHQGPL